MTRTSVVALAEGHGGPERIATIETPIPVPGPGEVLVQVVAAGVSHMDAYVREGRFAEEIPLAFPARQGSGFAGIVRGVGTGVAGVAVRDEVLGHDPAHGAYATHVVVPAVAVVKKPRTIPWEVASALHLVGLTAFELTQPLRLTERDVVLVTAAAGGVGHLECQLARLAGARVVGIAGRENHDYLRSIGVRPVAYDGDLAAAVRTAAGGEVTAVLDNYGGYDDLADRLAVLPARRVRSEDRRRVEIDLYTTPGDAARSLRLGDVAELIAEWNVRVLVSGFYPFTELDRAFADLEARHSRGVVVVGMDPSAPAREYLRGKLRARYEATAG